MHLVFHSAENANQIVVADNSELTGRLVRALSSDSGTPPILCTTGLDVMNTIHSLDFDLMIIDNRLADMEGSDLCRWIRRQKIHCPIIIRGDENSEAQEILSFEVGANDFVPVNLNPDVLAAKIRAHVRRYLASGRAKYRFGKFTFDPANEALSIESSPLILRLTGKQVALLRYFCVADGPVVRTEDLMRDVWDYRHDVDTHTLKTHISTLRTKLLSQFGLEEIIVKVPGGYRLVGCECGSKAQPIS